MPAKIIALRKNLLLVWLFIFKCTSCFSLRDNAAGGKQYSHANPTVTFS